MLGKIFKKFKKGGDSPTGEEAPKKLKKKLVPTDYYPVLFRDLNFSSKIQTTKKKGLFRRSKEESSQDQPAPPSGISKQHYEDASKLITQIKRHYRVESFRSHWKKLKVKPGVEGHSQVVVYGNIQISDEKGFPFYVFSGDVGLSCKLDQTPNFAEGRIAVLGTVHTTFESHPRLYLDVEILYLHKDDFM